MLIGRKMMWHGRCGMALGGSKHAPRHDDRQSCLPSAMTKRHDQVT